METARCSAASRTAGPPIWTMHVAAERLLRRKMGFFSDALNTPGDGRLYPSLHRALVSGEDGDPNLQIQKAEKR